MRLQQIEQPGCQSGLHHVADQIPSKSFPDATQVSGGRERGAAGGYTEARMVDGRPFANLLNSRGDNGSAVGGVMKFEVHATTDEAHLQHGTAPGRTCNCHLDRLGTEFGMP